MNKALYLIIFLFIALPAYSETITGKVVGVSDGDTLTVLTSDKKQVKIRLAEIDTPEKSQAYGQKAKQALSAMVLKSRCQWKKGQQIGMVR